MKCVLEINCLQKSYDDFNLNIDHLTLDGRSIMGLVGLNGSGKTTTINLILNEIKKDKGEIKIFGEDNISKEQLVKNKIGVIFDDFCLPKILNAQDVELIFKNIYSNWDTKKYMNYINLFNLQNKLPIEKYSQGMKVKLSFAIALSHSPSLLILDEATNGLDPIVRTEILELLKSFIKYNNNAVLISSHITSDLDQIADHIVLINDGKILFDEYKTDIENFTMLQCDKSMLGEIPKSAIKCIKKSNILDLYDVLLLNFNHNEANFSKAKVYRPNIEDLMKFYTNANIEI